MKYSSKARKWWTWNNLLILELKFGGTLQYSWPLNSFVALFLFISPSISSSAWPSPAASRREWYNKEVIVKTWSDAMLGPRPEIIYLFTLTHSFLPSSCLPIFKSSPGLDAVKKRWPRITPTSCTYMRFGIRSWTQRTFNFFKRSNENERNPPGTFHGQSKENTQLSAPIAVKRRIYLKRNSIQGLQSGLCCDLHQVLTNSPEQNTSTRRRRW